MLARANCNITSAQASVVQPQTVHSKWLSRKAQKPRWRRRSWRDYTSQEAITLTSIAGRWRKLIASVMSIRRILASAL